ncbi:helix-turn-helix domain-containing protein [Actinocorallia longicatena]|uniref:TetR/AcrR family transcriptional regulator n=1 Tax=Actinocorallia longicatena TaxID=111803 RepID=UPI0031D74A37
MQAARQAFAAEGFGVPLDEIARRAGVGPGTLYRHFPTKEALFEAIVRERLLLLVEGAKAARSRPDAAGALFGVIEAIVADAQAKTELIDALTGAGIDVQTEVAATAAKLREEVDALLRRAQHEGSIRDDVGAAELMALIGGVILALRGPQAIDPARALAVIRDGLRRSA